MKRIFVIAAVMVLLVAGLALYLRYEEVTYEFDCLNLRLRYCERTRLSLFDVVLSEKCSTPKDHAVATKLRELGILEPVDERESRWELVAGFKPGVRGWRGNGRMCIRALGATTFGTAVTLPAEEDMATNVWVKWALQDADAARQFWHKRQLMVAQNCDASIFYLYLTKEYLEGHKGPVALRDLETQVTRSLQEDWGYSLP